MDDAKLWDESDAVECKGLYFLPTHDSCYVCGQGHPTGLRSRFFADADGTVYAWFEPREDQTGYRNIVHGGVTSALLDELVGWTTALRNNRLARTAELTVRFSHAMEIGKKYLASAKLEKGRGRLWEARGDIRDKAGRIYAKASGKYFLATDELTKEMSAGMRYAPGDVQAFREAQGIG